MNSVSTALLATTVQFLAGQKELLWKEQRIEATYGKTRVKSGRDISAEPEQTLPSGDC